MVSLTKEGLVDGAKIAAESDMSFDEYCELISENLITGQSLGEVKLVLRYYELDEYFNEGKGQTVTNGTYLEKKIVTFFFYLIHFYLSEMGGTATNGASRFCHPPTVAGG